MTNPHSSEKSTTDGLSRAIWISIGAHLLFAAALTLRTVFYPSEPLILEDAIRVDIVGLPEKSKSIDLPQPISADPPKNEEEIKATKQEENPETKPVVEIPKPDAPKVNLDKAKRDQQAALKRLEALQKIEQMTRQQKVSGAQDKQNQPGQLVKGNEVSAGSSLRGIVRLEHDSYLRSIHSRVKSHWNLPQWLATANLNARVRLYVDSQGNVVKKEMVKSSQDPVYDQRVMLAIESASPLPPPPGSLVNLLEVDGIELDFVPQ